jgi:hypothetical protein
VLLFFESGGQNSTGEPGGDSRSATADVVGTVMTPTNWLSAVIVLENGRRADLAVESSLSDEVVRGFIPDHDDPENKQMRYASTPKAHPSFRNDLSGRFNFDERFEDRRDRYSSIQQGPELALPRYSSGQMRKLAAVESAKCETWVRCCLWSRKPLFLKESKIGLLLHAIYSEQRAIFTGH